MEIIEDDLSNLSQNFKLVYDEGGNPLLNGNNIVLQHRTSGEIGYIENTLANRALFNTKIESDSTEDQDAQIEIEDYAPAEFSHEEHWTDADTKKLIAIYRDNIEKFRNPRIKKKELWRNVASQFPSKTFDNCDKKFRNLKHHYLHLLKKKKKTRRGTVTWPYFNLMDELLAADSNVNPEPEVNVIETLCIEKENLSKSEPGTSTQSHQKEIFPKNTRVKKINVDLKKMLIQSEQRQTKIEEKVDRLIEYVRESNNIQKERNKLLETYITLYKTKK